MHNSKNTVTLDIRGSANYNLGLGGRFALLGVLGDDDAPGFSANSSDMRLFTDGEDTGEALSRSSALSAALGLAHRTLALTDCVGCM